MGGSAGGRGALAQRGGDIDVASALAVLAAVDAAAGISVRKTYPTDGHARRLAAHVMPARERIANVAVCYGDRIDGSSLRSALARSISPVRSISSRV